MIKVCPKCGVEHNKPGLYCSRQCANSRVWSEEDKLKKSISAKNSERVKLKNSLRKGEKKRREKRFCLNENCNKEFEALQSSTKKFCSISCAYSSSLYRGGKSQKTKQDYLNGRRVCGGITKWREVETSNGVIKVQGSYEERACKILDVLKSKKQIKDWEYTNDRVEYLINGEKHNYLLDFKVWNNINEFYYIETKGYEKEIDKIKWEAVKNKGLRLEVWFEKEIKEYETKYIT